MEETYFYKNTYAEAEMKELYQWFEAHMAKLPQELQLNESSVVRNLPYTVRRMINMVKGHTTEGSTIYNGYIANLMLIRHKLQQANATN